VTTQYAYGTEEIDRLLDEMLTPPSRDPHDDGPTVQVTPSHVRSLALASLAPENDIEPADVHTMATRRSPPIIIVDTDARMKRLTCAIWGLAAVLLLWLSWLVTHS
jgi:hypothetical protein